jgi:hypothetical protein
MRRMRWLQPVSREGGARAFHLRFGKATAYLDRAFDILLVGEIPVEGFRFGMASSMPTLCFWWMIRTTAEAATF